MINKLKYEMYKFYSGDPKRIQHFVKVHAFAKEIGEAEGLDEKTQFILETAAVVHDIGIKIAEEKFGKSNGKLQEQEGPAAAEKMLTELGFEKDVAERVCWLVGHHHTYNNITEIDYQILVEADFIVNLYEDDESKQTVETVLNKIFKTHHGIEICRTMFGI